MSKYIVDTHAILWYLTASPRLGKNATAVLSDPSSSLIVPTVAVAEACSAIAKGRVQLSSADQFIDDLLADARITIAPLDLDTVRRTLLLTGIPEMHDRQIAAAAHVFGTT